MDYYTAIKNNKFVSFIGIWMNLETIILSKLTQEQKMKYKTTGYTKYNVSKSIYFYFYYTLSSGLYVQIMQVCYRGIHVPWWWFAASITQSSTLGISPNAISLQSPQPPLFLP